MLRTFKNLIKSKPAPVANSTPKENKAVPQGWHSVLSAKELLDTPHRQKQLRDIWQNVSLTPDAFDKLYRAPIEKIVELFQLLPASESHHHSHMGGMIDHVLEVIAIASKLRQNYVLPQNASPELQAKQKDIWTAVVIYGAMLHDVGKIIVDLKVELQSSKNWSPLLGGIQEPYRFAYIKDRDYELHSSIGNLMLTQILPPIAIEWLSEYSNAFNALIAYLSGNNNKAGLLSEIIQKADQISVTMALGGDIQKIGETAKVSFGQQLKLALCAVAKQSKLNSAHGGANGYLTDDGLFLMSKNTADSIRAYLNAQGISVPSQNTKIFDELQSYNLIETTQNKTAIWHCNIASNAGWNPQNSFTLLKINPMLIWENIAEYPEKFDGHVTPIHTTNANETKPPISLEETENIQQLSMENSENKIAVNTEASNEIELSNNKESTPALEKKEDSDDLMEATLDILGFDDIKQEEQSVDESIDEIVELQEYAPNNNLDQPEQQEQHEQIKKPAKIKHQAIQEKTEKNEKPAVQQIKPIKTGTKSPNQVVYINKKMLDEFIDWVRAGISTRVLVMNEPKAMFHVVEDHLFMVSPTIFKSFLFHTQGNIDNKVADELQKDFQRLGWHKRCYVKEDDDYQNVWYCKVSGSRKSRLSGYLIEDKSLLIGNRIVPNNEFLTLKGNL